MDDLAWQWMEGENIVALLAGVVYPLLGVECVPALLVYAMRWFLILGYCDTSYTMLHWIFWQGNGCQGVIATGACGKHPADLCMPL